MDYMYILLWIVLGFVMGFLARAILPGEQKIGLIPTLIVGALGSFVGGFTAMKLGVDVSDITAWQSLVAALVGSIVVLVLFCLIFRGKWN